MEMTTTASISHSPFSHSQAIINSPNSNINVRLESDAAEVAKSILAELEKSSLMRTLQAVANTIKETIADNLSQKAGKKRTNFTQKKSPDQLDEFDKGAVQVRRVSFPGYLNELGANALEIETNIKKLNAGSRLLNLERDRKVIVVDTNVLYDVALLKINYPELSFGKTILVICEKVLQESRFHKDLLSDLNIEIWNTGISDERTYSHIDCKFALNAEARKRYNTLSVAQQQSTIADMKILMQTMYLKTQLELLGKNNEVTFASRNAVFETQLVDGIKTLSRSKLQKRYNYTEYSKQPQAQQEKTFRLLLKCYRSSKTDYEAMRKVMILQLGLYKPQKFEQSLQPLIAATDRVTLDLDC